ncbi:uncharacterized protein LOC112342084 [Selaginella moellendorffii]|uniref:uncharacterized protein LOC112342084 n=1 Tax=Selaginella moellendorffii TaxID=88036 RepID=UPI000D1CED49|nr:uncharacterized protein LOC112342084 [Selaginella moellendorffii]|eukprot:XP_024519092.1 uncharacterized protein LOC112342084 [Selaginella moellendorffii]
MGGRVTTMRPLWWFFSVVSCLVTLSSQLYFYTAYFTLSPPTLICADCPRPSCHSNHGYRWSYHYMDNFEIGEQYSAIRYWRLACFTDALYILLVLGSLTGGAVGVLAYFHYRWCMLISVAVGAISAALSPLAPTSSWFIVLQVLSAMGHACAAVASVCRLVEEVPVPSQEEEVEEGWTKPSVVSFIPMVGALFISTTLSFVVPAYGFYSDWKQGNMVVALADAVLIVVLTVEMVILAVIDRRKNKMVKGVNHC